MFAGKEGPPEAMVKIWKGYELDDLKKAKKKTEMLSVKYDGIYIVGTNVYRVAINIRSEFCALKFLRPEILTSMQGFF